MKISKTNPAPTETRVGTKEIREAAEILAAYQQGKANLEKRIVNDELWYKLRHWDVIRQTEHGRRASEGAPEPASAWLFNAILNKHADAMDNYPEAVVLPRERSDEISAKTLSAILPVVMESNGFDETYAAAWWKKLKHGTAAYGVFWDPAKENGLGDITIQEIDLLRVFWEPGITDIQRSRNLFIVDLIDAGILERQYPQFRADRAGNVIDLTQYTYDDSVSTAGKVLVVDWYYKRRSPGGRTVLHYVKFAGETLLYASENDPVYAERGFYDHGLYPVHFDVLFPEEGTPVGFGYVSICKDPQSYIDRLYGNILDYALKATHPRHFIAASTGVNEQEYADWSQPLVHVEGTLDDTRIRQISLDPMSGIYTNILQMKIEEMKDTAANRDVNSGGVSGGVTAASAIAALQEAGNKASRDMIGASYRCYVRLCKMCIELMRQFYDEARSFRVAGPGGTFGFVDFNNALLVEQPAGFGASGAALYRRPVFDLKINAQKRNPFSRMEQNERAKELYGMGFFNPERAQEALGALEMMDFEGIDAVREQARQGSTLLRLCEKLSRQLELLTAPYDGGDAAAAEDARAAGGRSAAAERLRASTPGASYLQRLAEKGVG